VLFESASLPAETAVHLRLLMKFARRLLHATYLRRYFELRPDSLDALEYWRVPQRMAGLAWRAERKRMNESSRGASPSIRQGLPTHHEGDRMEATRE
jgi:hypothetical protein